VTASNAIGASPESVYSDWYETGAVAPTQPIITDVVVGDGFATVSYTVDNGGAPILEAVVASDPEGRTVTVNSAQSSIIVDGLHNLTTYTFTVRVANSLGQSPVSAPSQPVTPFFPGTFGPAGGIMKAEEATNVEMGPVLQPIRSGHARMVRVRRAVQNH
jgi:hypothetical protein